MGWYTFMQNNSGGSFVTDEQAGIAVNVIVEASSTEVANARAEAIGLYFDGDGDCPCCGNRWYEASKYDEVDSPNIYGDQVVACAKDEAAKDWGTYLGFIHPLEGPFSYIKYKE